MKILSTITEKVKFIKDYIKKSCKFLLYSFLVIITIILIYLAYGFIWENPEEQVNSYIHLTPENLKNEKEKLSLIKELRITNGQIVGGIIASLILIVQFWRAISFSSQVKEEKRSNLSSQTNEQFIKAVELLNNDSPTIKLGAIYTLEKILNSKEKIQQEYHNIVLEFLCAYFREHSPFDKKVYEKEPSKYEKAIPFYLETILKVIGSRKNNENEYLKIDLSNTCLKDAQLADLDLSNIIFDNSFLKGIRLNGCILKDSEFNYTILSESDFTLTIFENCNLSNADLSNSNLSGTRIFKSRLINTKLQNSYISSELLDLDFLVGEDNFLSEYTGINFKKYNPIDFKIFGPQFTNSKLFKANLSNTQLGRVKFENCNLSLVDFRNIDLHDEVLERDDTDDFINELKKAENIAGILLDDKIIDRIKEIAPELLDRINEKGE